MMEFTYKKNRTLTDEYRRLVDEPKGTLKALTFASTTRRRILSGLIPMAVWIYCRTSSSFIWTALVHVHLLMMPSMPSQLVEKIFHPRHNPHNGKFCTITHCKLVKLLPCSIEKTTKKIGLTLRLLTKEQ